MPQGASGGEVARLNARIDELKHDWKWTYEDGIEQSCKEYLLEERLVKYKDTNPFHGKRNELHDCFEKYDCKWRVGNGIEYSTYGFNK